MMSTSNLKIGRKIACVLGGTILLMVGLCGLSLWGIHTIERLGEDTAERLRNAQLAERVTSADASVNATVGKIVYDNKVSEDLLKQLRDFEDMRSAAVAEFKAKADTPENITQAAELSELAKVKTAASERVLGLVRAHRFLVVEEDVAPHGGIGRRDTREIAKAAGEEFDDFALRHRLPDPSAVPTML